MDRNEDASDVPRVTLADPQLAPTPPRTSNIWKVALANFTDVSAATYSHYASHADSLAKLDIVATLLPPWILQNITNGVGYTSSLTLLLDHDEFQRTSD